MASTAGEPIAVISWDVDGTLYSMSRMVRSLIWSALGGLAVRPLATRRELALLRRFRRQMDRVRAAGGALAGALPDDRDAIVRVEERWYGRAIGRAGPRPGVADAIAAARAAGLRQIVVSDYEPGYKLAALGLTGSFEAVYAGERLGHLKPSADLFRRVAADLGVPPSAILHIGDRSDRDGAAATAAGCACLILGRDLRVPADLLTAAPLRARLPSPR